MIRPTPRRATWPTCNASKQCRADGNKRRSHVKSKRGGGFDDEQAADKVPPRRPEVELSHPTVECLGWRCTARRGIAPRRSGAAALPVACSPCPCAFGRTSCPFCRPLHLAEHSSPHRRCPSCCLAWVCFARCRLAGGVRPLREYRVPAMRADRADVIIEVFTNFIHFS